MSAVTREAVEARLRQFTDPHLNQDPVSAGCLREVDIQGGKVAVRQVRQKAKQSLEKLEKEMHRVASVMYEKAGPQGAAGPGAPGAAPPPGGDKGKGKDGVIDAEFEEGS